MDNKFIKVSNLIGEKNYESFSNKTILICGIGGVGSVVFEALVRSGAKHLIICDYDTVNETNLNRQILYFENDIGKYKVDVAKEYAKNINKDIEIECIKEKITKDSISIFDNYGIDFIVDAIDFVEGKIAIIQYALNKNIPYIISLGMANKLDPLKIKIEKLNKTTSDPLARKMRHDLKLQNIDTGKIDCVFSSETPFSFKGSLNSIITVTATAGLLITNFVISYFSGKI